MLVKRSLSNRSGEKQNLFTHFPKDSSCEANAQKTRELHAEETGYREPHNLEIQLQPVRKFSIRERIAIAPSICEVVVQDLATLWTQTQDSSRYDEKFAAIPCSRKQGWSDLHCKFFGSSQKLAKFCRDSMTNLLHLDPKRMGSLEEWSRE